MVLLCITLVCGFAVSTSNTPLPVGHVGAAPLSTGAPQEASVGELIEETGFYQSIRLTQEAPLYRKQSAYQLIEVRRSPYYGKVLVLDGVVQLTERDGNSYNEVRLVLCH
jgi:Spermidine synthase tetramerisation domain